MGPSSRTPQDSFSSVSPSQGQWRMSSLDMVSILLKTLQLCSYIHVTVCPGSSLGFNLCGRTLCDWKTYRILWHNSHFLCCCVFFFISCYNSLLTPVSCAHYKWFCFYFKETTPLQQWGGMRVMSCWAQPFSLYLRNWMKLLQTHTLSLMEWSGG